MKARRVAPGRGWAWIVEGWRLFTKSPGLWMAMTVVYFVVTAAASYFIPIFEFFIMLALHGGMVYGAAALDQGQGLEFWHLFQTFRDWNPLKRILALGVILLVALAVIFILARTFIGGGGTMEGEGSTMSAIDPLGLTLVLLVGLLFGMTAFYSVPLIMLARITTLQAIPKSLSACLINILPLLVYGLVGVALFVLAAIPFGLGFLVLNPVLSASAYASYRDVFGEESTVNLGPISPGQSQ